MKIGLHDDNTGFPNLALMKLSAWHKQRGDTMNRFTALERFDRIYSSKVFTFTPKDPYLPESAELGGIGYGLYDCLPDVVEHICPDYELYGERYSMGFLTRGCNRSCPWCFVPAKEGPIRAHADVTEFLRHRDVVLLDNNVLASHHGLMQIEKMAGLKVRVDFNQGLDARLIDDAVARLLGKLTWLKPLRLACDTAAMIPVIQRAVSLLRWHNVTPSQYFCYCLVDDVDDALERVRFLKGIYVYPFCQPLVIDNGPAPTKEQKYLCEWVNQRPAFRSCTFEEFLEAKRRGKGKKYLEETDLHPFRSMVHSRRFEGQAPHGKTTRGNECTPNPTGNESR